MCQFCVLDLYIHNKLRQAVPVIYANRWGPDGGGWDVSVVCIAIISTVPGQEWVQPCLKRGTLFYESSSQFSSSPSDINTRMVLNLFIILHQNSED